MNLKNLKILIEINNFNQDSNEQLSNKKLFDIIIEKEKEIDYSFNTFQNLVMGFEENRLITRKYKHKNHIPPTKIIKISQKGKNIIDSIISGIKTNLPEKKEKIIENPQKQYYEEKDFILTKEDEMDLQQKFGFVLNDYLFINSTITERRKPKIKRVQKNLIDVALKTFGFSRAK